MYNRTQLIKLYKFKRKVQMAKTRCFFTFIRLAVHAKCPGFDPRILWHSGIWGAADVCKMGSLVPIILIIILLFFVCLFLTRSEALFEFFLWKSTESWRRQDFRFSVYLPTYTFHYTRWNVIINQFCVILFYIAEKWKGYDVFVSWVRYLT